MPNMKRFVFPVFVALFLLTGCKEYQFDGRMWFSYTKIPIFNEAVQVKTATENKKIKAANIHWKNQDLPVTILDSYCFESATIGESCEAKLRVNFKPVFDISGLDTIADGKKIMDGTFTFQAKPGGTYDGKMTFENWIDGTMYSIEIVLPPPRTE